MAWYDTYKSVYNKPIDDVDDSTFELVKNQLKKVQSDTPFVTVSIIAYNEEEHLLSCLWSLSMQECKYPMEIIGVNNDSADRTEEVYKRLDMPYYNEMQHSCGFARQCGLSQAKGKYHINIDADTMYPAKYVETMVDAMEKPGVVGACGTWSYMPDKDHSSFSLMMYEKSRDFYLWMQQFKRPELSVRGLVFAYDTKLAQKYGIRTDIKRGEDGTLAYQLKNHGRIVFVRNSKTRAVTGYDTVALDGSFGQSFWNRVKLAFRRVDSLWSKADKYEDDDSNLVK